MGVDFNPHLGMGGPGDQPLNISGIDPTVLHSILSKHPGLEEAIRHTPGLAQTIGNFINMIKQDLKNHDTHTANQRFEQGGYFEKTLEGFGIKKPEDLAGIFEMIKKGGGIEETSHEQTSTQPQLPSLFAVMKELASSLQPKPPLKIEDLIKKYPGLEGNLTNLINILKMDINNKAPADVINNHFKVPDGDFTKILNSLGIKDPKEIAAIFGNIKEKAGYKPDVQPVETLSIDALIKQYPGLEGNIANMITILKMDISNKAPTSVIDNHFKIPDGDFTKILNSLGIKDPKEIAAIFNHIKEAAGLQKVDSDPSATFKQALIAWRDDPSRTPKEKDFANAMLNLIQSGMTKEKIQDALNKFLNGQGVDSIFRNFGIDPKNFPSLSAALSGVTLQFPTPTDMDKGYILAYQLPEPFSKSFLAALNTSKDFAAFSAFVKDKIIPDPRFNTLSTDLQTRIKELVGFKPDVQPLQPIIPVTPVVTPTTIPKPDDATLQKIKDLLDIMMKGPNSYRELYLKNLAGNIKNMTPAQLLLWKQGEQKKIDAMFSNPSENMLYILKSRGFTEPQLTQLVNYIKQEAGFYPPIDDRIRNFLNGPGDGIVQGGQPGIKDWMNAPGRTPQEKLFAQALMSIVKPGMTDDEIRNAVNKFLNEKGAQDIFIKFGIDPKHFRTIATMLAGVKITFPIPTAMENAYIQSYKLPEALGAKIREALAQFPDNFAGFKAYVQANQSTLLAGASAADKSLVLELSGNQPSNTPPPPKIGPYGSALFTYINNSGLPDSQVFVQVVLIPNSGPYKGQQCFVKFNRDGTFEYIPAKDVKDPSQYSYALSYFNRSADGKGANFYIPAGDGGRLYTSIGQPLSFKTDGQGGIIHPDAHLKGDFNNSIRWEKSEYTVSKDMIFFNATAVDSVNLPVLVGVKRNDGSLHQGGLTQDVIAKLTKRLKDLGKPWFDLVKGNTILSIMDAAGQNIFPQNYFLQPPGKSWMDAFFDKYSKTPLMIRTNDSRIEVPPKSGNFIDDGKGLWKATVIDRDKRIIEFTKEPPTPGGVNKLTMTMPDNTKDLLAGNGSKGWGMYDVQSVTNKLYEQGILKNGTKDSEGNYVPCLSDEAIQNICYDPANGGKTLDRKPLKQVYGEMKVAANLARDISVAVSTNTLGAKSDQVLTNRLFEIAHDLSAKGDNRLQYLFANHKMENGNWVPSLSWDDIKKAVDLLPSEYKGPTGMDAMYNEYKKLHDQGIDEAPLCQDTFKGTYHTAFGGPNPPPIPNPNFGMQFFDPIAATIAASGIRQTGHENDVFGDIYVGAYTDSTGHEGAASAVPTEAKEGFASGFLTLGKLEAGGDSGVYSYTS